MEFQGITDFEANQCPMTNGNLKDLPFDAIQQKNGIEHTIALFVLAQNSPSHEVLTDDEKELFNRQIEVMEELWDIVRNRAILQEEREETLKENTFNDALTPSFSAVSDFSSAVQWLKAQKCLRRTSWPEGTFVVKQVPADIPSEIIPKMTSLPDSVKNLLLSRSADASIHYRHQMLQIDRNGIANAWQPNAEDVFAEDWQLVMA